MNGDNRLYVNLPIGGAMRLGRSLPRTAWKQTLLDVGLWPTAVSIAELQ